MPILELKRVRFYSDADESAFFAFARSITSVQKVAGSRDAILLHVAARPSQQSLGDLIALFERYGVTGMLNWRSFARLPTHRGLPIPHSSGTRMCSVVAREPSNQAMQLTATRFAINFYRDYKPSTASNARSR